MLQEQIDRYRSAAKVSALWLSLLIPLGLLCLAVLAFATQLDPVMRTVVLAVASCILLGCICLAVMQGFALSDAQKKASALAFLPTRLNDDLASLRDRAQKRLASRGAAAPAIRARNLLVSGIARLQVFREQADALQAKKSFWQQLTTDPPDHDRIDGEIQRLERALETLDASGEVARAESEHAALVARTNARLDRAAVAARRSLAMCHTTPPEETASLARAGMWLGALSLPVSAAIDLSRAGEVYGALRAVNGNFADMSDTEIWLETLFMPADSLAGLASLTKGAWFEQQAASATGGALFENFNHAETDITIDGIAYQLKATDAASYIDSVAEDIPIIATSEVADATRALDSGISNADLDHATDLALGGSVIDMGDSATDALLTGFGGVGVLASLRGINHAAKAIKAGEDPELALLEGVELAVTGTLKATVDSAEMVYRAATSRPARLAARTTLGAVKVTGRLGLGTARLAGRVAARRQKGADTGDGESAQ